MTKRIIALLLTLALLMTVVSGTLVVFAVSEPGTTDGTEPSSTSVETTDGTEPDGTASVETTDGTEPDGTASVETTDGTVPEGTSSVETTDGTVPEGTSSVETTGEATEPPQLPPQMAPILSPTIGALGALIPSLDMMNAATRAASNPLDGMGQIEHQGKMHNRAFYIIRNWDDLRTKPSEKRPAVMGEIESGAYKSVEATQDIVTSTRILDVDGLTKWLIESTGTKGEYYIKRLDTGKYMNFTGENGAVSLSDDPVPTRIYGYIKDCGSVAHDQQERMTVYAFVQTGADGKDYVLREVDDSGTFKGFCLTDAAENFKIKEDHRSLFMMKDAHYTVDFGNVGIVTPTEVDAVINIFNYDGNTKSITNLEFYHDENAYTQKMSAPLTDENATFAVDGQRPAVNEASDDAPAMNPMLDENGYPSATDRDNIGLLFNPNNGYFQGKMRDGGGLFKKDGSYYVYDSRENAAWYDQANNKFVLYDAVLSPPYTQTHYQYINNPSHDPPYYEIAEGSGIQNRTGDVESGNFLPFNRLTSETAFNEGTVQEIPYGTPRYSLKPEAGSLDMWFGMSLEFEFTMPDNGQINNEDMVFEFFGDDDVWVYIDDVLVLDIGGIHYAAEGKINFRTGQVKDPNRSGDWNVKSLGDLLSEQLSDEEKAKLVSGNTLRADNKQKHTLKFFYLERGGNVSHCRIKFNIPPTPSYDLKITKTGIEDIDNDADETQTTIYNIEGITSGKNEHIAFQVAITGNGSAIIANLPEGRYRITEVTDWSWRYDVVGNKSVEVDIGVDFDTPSITFKNERKRPDWLSGDCYCENWFSPGNSVMPLKDEDQTTD